ncbi:hypothetical protein PHLGIDRAFT_333253 [Phlebiopsis gigantea 11061_1 CR5-6]|uniref:Uncharacterized protein n=1 Tax=Phlebiopsis gigantea (strain 11061_1 CR5-6) TaxID=745531 RepID=A0A0C3NVF0_PHLG1|nr:hypothetical protein PHLGIDRAFT_333253 [Phlebiopsis gigantea 11061_1 CR5-6]
MRFPGYVFMQCLLNSGTSALRRMSVSVDADPWTPTDVVHSGVPRASLWQECALSDLGFPTRWTPLHDIEPAGLPAEILGDKSMKTGISCFHLRYRHRNSRRNYSLRLLRDVWSGGLSPASLSPLLHCFIVSRRWNGSYFSADKHSGESDGRSAILINSMSTMCSNISTSWYVCYRTRQVSEDSPSK